MKQNEVGSWPIIMKKVTGVIWSLVNAMSLHLECVMPCMIHCWYPFLRMIWSEKERSRIMALQMNNLRGLLGVRRMDKVPNSRIRKLC